MLDLGFTHITAWDIDLEPLRGLEGVRLDTVNLETDFADSSITEQFGLVLAVEILEHVENPFHFASQLKKLLTPGGFAVITTPNIESALSRVGILREGWPQYFGDYHCQVSGHITPLTLWQMKVALERAELNIIEQSHNLRGMIIPWIPGTFREHGASAHSVGIISNNAWQ